jgi:hypothetical protein
LILSRLVNILFALVLLAALVIAFDPNARAKAVAAVRSWEPELRQLNGRVLVNAPSLSLDVPNGSSTPVPTATSPADADLNEQIPVTGENDSTNKPIIQVNWDALGEALKKLWVSLSNVKINVTPKDNK